MWNTGCYPAHNLKQIHRWPLLSRGSDILPSSAFFKWGPKMWDHHGNWTCELSQNTWNCHSSILCLDLLHTTCKMMKAFPSMPKGESQPQARSTNTSATVINLPFPTWSFAASLQPALVQGGSEVCTWQTWCCARPGVGLWYLELIPASPCSSHSHAFSADHPLVCPPLVSSPCILIPNSQLSRAAPHYLPFANHTSSYVSAPCLGFAEAPGHTLPKALPQKAVCNFWLWIWWALREVFSENTFQFLLLPTTFPVHTMYSGESPTVLADLVHFSKETDT